MANNNKQITLSGSLALTKLKFVKMVGKGKEGKPVPGIFIPIEANKLVVGVEKDGVTPVYMPIRVIYNTEPDQNGQNGFMAKSVSTEEYKAATTDEAKTALREFQPILGSLKDFSNYNAADTGGAVSAEEYTPDDDLPF